MNTQRDYGDLMQFLLYFREQYSDEDEFNKFVMESLRSLVYDLRDLGVYISISPQSLKWPLIPISTESRLSD
jgi:hypothetical protein